LRKQRLPKRFYRRRGLWVGQNQNLPSPQVTVLIISNVAGIMLKNLEEVAFLYFFVTFFLFPFSHLINMSALPLIDSLPNWESKRPGYSRLLWFVMLTFYSTLLYYICFIMSAILHLAGEETKLCFIIPF
jgi:hypothetical protein